MLHTPNSTMLLLLLLLLLTTLLQPCRDKFLLEYRAMPAQEALQVGVVGCGLWVVLSPPFHKIGNKIGEIGKSGCASHLRTVPVPSLCGIKLVQEVLGCVCLE